MMKKNIGFNNGALHTGPWIRIRCGSRIQIQWPLCFYTGSIWIRAARMRPSSAVQFVYYACHEELTRHHIIWIGNPNPVNRVSVPVWRAPVLFLKKTCLTRSVWYWRKSWKEKNQVFLQQGWRFRAYLCIFKHILMAPFFQKCLYLLVNITISIEFFFQLSSFFHR